MTDLQEKRIQRTLEILRNGLQYCESQQKDLDESRDWSRATDWYYYEGMRRAYGEAVRLLSNDLIADKE